MTLSPDAAVTSSIATMEPVALTSEQEQYSNIAETQQIDAAMAHNGIASSRLNGDQSRMVGPARMMQVKRGDTVKMEVYGRYNGNTGSNTSTVAGIASAVADAFGLSTGTGESQLAYDVVTATAAALAGSLTPADDEIPAGYLNYLLFDDNYQLEDLGYQPLTTSGLNQYERLAMDIIVPKSGYIYIYVANESALDLDVFFDDMAVTLAEGPIVQADDYYPFGLKMKNLGTEGDVKFSFGGKENLEDIGALDFNKRYYSPDIARFLQVDPKTEIMTSHGPYQYGFNNPIMMVDPTGMMPSYYYNWEDGKYYHQDKNGDEKAVSYEEAINSAISGTRTNVAVAVENDIKLNEFANSLEYDKGTWHVILGNSFSDLNAKLQRYLDGGQIDNLMVFAHGNDEGGVIVPFGNSRNYINSNVIERYLIAQARGQEITGAPYQLTALQEMSRSVKEQGNLIFSTCWACRGDDGRNLAIQLNKLTGGRINIFLNQDYSIRTYNNGLVDIWTGKGLTPESSLREGWIKVDPKGELIQLRDLPGKRGNIRDSRRGKSPVQIE